MRIHLHLMLVLFRIHRRGGPRGNLYKNPFSLSLPYHLPYSVLLSLTFHTPGSDYAAPVGPCNQSFNSYCTRKRIIRCCCVLYDGGRNTHRSLASKMAIHRSAHVLRRELRTCLSFFRITNAWLSHVLRSRDRENLSLLIFIWFH